MSSTWTTSSSSMNVPSKWPNLPRDILTTIATLVGTDIGPLRLRSICHSWRISLPLSVVSTTASPPSFPLSLPHPISAQSPLFLFRHILYLVTPSVDPIPTNHMRPSCTYSNIYDGSGLIGPHPVDPTTSVTRLNDDAKRSHMRLTGIAMPNPSFLLNVQRTSPNSNNNFSLLTPFSSTFPVKLNHTLNLLNFGITVICSSYSITLSDFFRKIVVFTGSDGVVVLGLSRMDGKLLLWKEGDNNWTLIIHKVRVFDDIVLHNGKFYATVDRKGRLVMIDVNGEKVIDIVPSLMYGCGYNTSLVGCDAGLYLVDQVSVHGKGLELDVFKLDEKGRFWDYEFDVNGSVFFLGDGVNLCLSRKDYNGSVKDVIFFNHDDEGAMVWDMKTRAVCPLAGNEECNRLFWPPNYFEEAVTVPQ